MHFNPALRIATTVVKHYHETHQSDKMHEKEKEIITGFDNLISENIKVNGLKENADVIKSNPFFIGEKATDARLDFNITTDISFIQSDLIYTTGILYTLRPLINNPIAESKHFMGKQRATYFQNLYDSLYSMYASFCYEKLYNFWDRIGDKIATEFPTEFSNPKFIMFANVIDRIRANNSENENLNWLFEFKDSDFREFNERRKKVVHYEQIETKYMESILDNMSDMEKVEEIWNEKYSLPEFFKKHIELTNKGIENTYEFVKSRRK